MNNNDNNTFTALDDKDVTNIIAPTLTLNHNVTVRKRICSVCGEIGHNRRTCPSVKANGTYNCTDDAVGKEDTQTTLLIVPFLLF
jgi:hypothetical protein